MQNNIENNNCEIICSYRSCPIPQRANEILSEIIRNLIALNKKSSTVAGISRYVSRKRCKYESDALYRFRRKCRLTMEDMAYLLEVDPLTVCRWENNQTTPRTKMQERIIELEKIGVRRIKKLLWSKIRQKNP